MSSRLKRLAPVLAAVLLLAGACSDGGGEEQAAENPKEAFTEALDAFAEYEGVTVEMTVQADADDLAMDGTSVEDAEKILNSSLTISGRGSTPEDQQVEVVVNVDGNEDAVVFRGLGSSLYARAEVSELVETFGGNPAEIDAAVDAATAQGLDFAEPIVEGEWVGVEGLDELAEQFGVPIQTPDPEQAAALQERLAAVLEQNAEVTSEGTDDTGAHLVVSLPLRETVQELFQVLETVGGAPEGSIPTDQLDQLPNGDVPIDAWISDGRLVQIELDAVAIAEAFGEEPPEGIERLAFRLAIDEFTDEIEAPDDFVEIDVQEILQGVFGAAMGAAGSDSAGAEIAVPPGGDREVVLPELGLACTDLQMLSGAEIESFLEASGVPGAVKKVRQACPELF